MPSYQNRSNIIGYEGQKQSMLDRHWSTFHPNRVDEYDQLIANFNEWWNIDEIKSQHKIPQDLKIEDLQLSLRLANCLSNMNVVYLHQLLKYKETDLYKNKEFWAKINK